MYDAFISYRHSELDKFAAENLHKKLEAFRLPKSIVAKRPEGSKTKIKRVFRDKDELPLASNLADPITAALEESEFLIVICSPRLPQSMWCKKEIETFISMHGRERMLAVLVEGEPEEAFPDGLLYAEKEVTEPDGTVRRIREKVEPLAADIRGSSKKEILKAMNEELLRLCAAMFGCGYDDLKQRHKEQRMKRILTASLAASACFLVFGAVSTTMALRIQMQKQQIQKQSDEISEQNKKIESQYQEALKNQSRFLAEKSTGLLAEGDRLAALDTAISAFQDTRDGTPMPHTSEAEYALSQSLYVYRNGRNHIPKYMLKHDTALSFMEISPDGSRALTVDQYGTIYIWDIAANKRLCEIATDTVVSYGGENKYHFLDDNRIIYNRNYGFEIYDISSEEVLLPAEEETNYYDGSAVSPDGVWMAVALSREIRVYHADTLEQAYTYPCEEGKNLGEQMIFDAQRGWLLFTRLPSLLNGIGGSSILAMDLKDGTVVREYQTEVHDVTAMLVDGDSLYLGTNDGFEKLNDITADSFYETQNYVYSLNLEQDGKVNWIRETGESLIHELKISDDAASNHLYVQLYSQLLVLNTVTGEEEGGFELGTEIVGMLRYKDKDAAGIFTREGIYIYADCGNMTSYEREGYFQVVSNNVYDFEICKEGFLVLPYNSNKVIVFDQIVGEEYAMLSELGKQMQSVCVNEAEDRILVVGYEDGKTVALLDDKGIPIAYLDETEHSSVIDFAGDGNEYFFVADTNKIRLYRVNDGALQEELELENQNISRELCVTADRKYLINNSYQNMIFVTDILTGKEVCQAELSGEAEGLSEVAVSNGLEICAVAGKTERKLSLYHLGETTAYAQLDVPAAFVKRLFFDQSDSYLFVSYMDESLEVYQLDTQELVHTFEDLNMVPEQIIQPAGSDYYFLNDVDTGYVISKDWEITAKVDGAKNVMPKAGLFLAQKDENLYTVPVYSLEKLLETGNKVLSLLN